MGAGDVKVLFTSSMVVTSANVLKCVLLKLETGSRDCRRDGVAYHYENVMTSLPDSRWKNRFFHVEYDVSKRSNVYATEVWKLGRAIVAAMA